MQKLLWGNDEHINYIQNNYEPFDLIIGSDLLYEPLNYPSLLATVLKLSEQHTVTVFGHPKRHLGEKQFLCEASKYFKVTSLLLHTTNTHVYQFQL